MSDANQANPDQTPGPKTFVKAPEGVASIQPDSKPETGDAESALETAGKDDVSEAAPEPAAPVSGASAPAVDPVEPMMNGKTPATTRDVVIAYAGAGGGIVPAEARAIEELGSSLKSLDTTTASAHKALTQSASMQIGSHVSLSNAVSTYKDKMATAIKHFGAELANEVHRHLVLVGGLKHVALHETTLENLTPPPKPD